MKILCLDDEPLALKMLETCVKQAKPDADVCAFDDQDELLEEAEKNGCDIAFLDIHMGGMNGVEVAKRLKNANPKMSIIFVTGFSEYKGDAMDMKASGYIMKPVTKEEVERELSDLRFPIIPKSNALLRVQCFGNFDVFLPNGEHVRFERSKSK
ncbi:MAG: response regulator [Ruminiclostridium sp.]|nr:response regulator [Ruminiclostridium sp.]